MNRTLKRPMFRIGGSAGTGITSGLDRPGYKDPLPAAVGSTKERLLKAIGQQPSNRNMSQFLTQFGLNLLSQPAQGSGFGGLLSTAATAAQEPTKSLYEDLDAERDLQRQVALAAEQSDIAQEQATELQLLKNLDKSTSNIIEKEIQARINDLGETREQAAKIVLNKRAYGVLDQPGELRRKSIDERSAIIQSNERLSKPAADQKATYEVDFSKIQKDNEDVDFDIMNPFWTPSRKNYQEGSVYIDYVTGKAFRRDSSAPATPGVPEKFVEIQIKY